jgi:ankyrin repeat protein
MVLFALLAGVDVEAKDTMGATALHWACYNGSIDVVRFLMVCCASYHAR